MNVKTCRKCGISKNLDDFYRQQATSDGRGSYCKTCSKAYTAAWAKENPERTKSYRRKYKYGVSQEDYDFMLRSQEGRCAICKKESKLVIDHDHETGRVRGLLCHQCNVSIERVCRIFLGEARAYLDGAYGLPD